MADDGSVYLGLDFGTSGARAALISAEGGLLAEWREPYDIAIVDSWRYALFRLLAGIPAEFRRHLAAIAFDGTSSTVVLCDGNGRPVTSTLLYNDQRAKVEAQALQTLIPEENPAISASSSLAKLLWLAKQPGADSARFFLHQADWLAAQLHGHWGVSDYHNALKLGYDVTNLRYPEWVNTLPVAPWLPHVVVPGESVGPLRPEIAREFALPQDCLVRAGTTDSIAAFLAAGASQPGEAVTSLGSTLALKLLSATRIDAPRYGIYSHRLGNLWLAGGASNSGGAVLKRFFSDDELAELSLRIDPRQDSGLDYYPLPAPGERFPLADPELEPRLDPRPAEDSRFLHGMLEGMAKIEAAGYRLLEQLGATPLKSVQTAGGGARNPAWTAIRARLLGVPVKAAAHGEAAYGTALLARSGPSLYNGPN